MIMIYIRYLYNTQMPKCQSCLSAKATHGKKYGNREYCSSCAKGLADVVNLTRKMCREETCSKEPTYNFPNEKTTAYCSIHKKPGMEDLKHKKCEHVDSDGNKCKLLATYGPQGEHVKYCQSHALLHENMVVIRTTLCKYKDENGVSCTTRASFNAPGTKSAKWCKLHKQDGDVFVLKVDKCKEEGCETRASFNHKNADKPLYCDAHKLIGMVNIVDARCEHDGCVKMATFAGADKIKRFCAEHKEDGMKNIRSKKCAHPGCEKEPTQNISGTKIRLYCAEHAEAGMVNVKNKRCVSCNVKEAFCNFKGEKSRLYCTRCRNEGMIDLSQKYCKNDYNIDGKIFQCLTRIANEKYDGYCVRCFVGLFPNESRSRNYKTKEYRVFEYIKEQFPDIDIICDKVVSSGYSKRRPDMCIYKDDYNIIIEVDENQHNDYEAICENKRMMELFLDLKNKPLVMIRFNPDDYIDESKKMIKSCWSYSKQGMSIINKNKKTEWQQRLGELKNKIEYYLHNPPTKELEVTYLYYDHI